MVRSTQRLVLTKTSLASTALAALLVGALGTAQPALGQAVNPSVTNDQGALSDVTPDAKTRTGANQDSKPDESIVVTGSRVARRDITSSSPLEVIDSKALDTRGFTTVAEALNELPAFGVPGASPVGFGQSSFGAGQSFVNFLGLGSQRTLVLVNSRRFVSGNTSSILVRPARAVVRSISTSFRPR